MRLRVTTGLTDGLLEGLRGGRFDLAIATSRPRGRTLSAVPLADEEFVLVAAPAWAGRIGRDRVAAEGPAVLHGVPLISYAEDLPIARRYWRHVFGVRLTGQAAVTVPDLRGVLAAAVAGAGISVLPAICASTSWPPARWSPCWTRRTRRSTPRIWCGARECRTTRMSRSSRNGSWRPAGPGDSPRKVAGRSGGAPPAVGRTKEFVTCPVPARVRNR